MPTYIYRHSRHIAVSHSYSSSHRTRIYKEIMASNSNSVLTRSNKGDKAKQNSIASYMSQNNKTNPKDGVTTDILNEILAKLNEQGKALNNLQSDVSIVKTDISNIKTIVKECVAEELADRDEAWQKEKEFIYNNLSVLEQ